MSAAPLRVGIVGCGLVGRKRAKALRADDTLVACTDADVDVAHRFAAEFGGQACVSAEQLFDLDPDVVVVATPHDLLTPFALVALEAGAHVLVEKPAGLGTAQVEEIARTAERRGRMVKVGFNHRFHPGLARAAEEVRSGRHGDVLYVRGRYGHGGRLGYENEWRLQPERSGGGELVDQGMHLLDLVHWLAGPLPLHSALLRTQFWSAPVEDNAALLLGDATDRQGPWALLHASWTEWKNTFSLEISCRTAKLAVDGLVRSYGPQTLSIYRMSPELGPPELEVHTYPDEDVSWTREWEHFAKALAGEVELMGSPADAHYAWSRVEDAYR
jgi:predicted dehydrogenase